MPIPSIPAGNLYMNATTYTGNSSTQSIANGATGAAFQPDLVWIKNRTGANNNILTDSVRGTSKILISDSTIAELTNANALTAFNSNGFSLGYDSSAIVNASANSYVGWQWKAGGTAVSNTAGTITSQVSANTTSGFSIVTFTGTGATSSGVTIGHGLGATPAFVITKKRSAGTDYGWSSWHKDLGGNYGIWLEQASARNPGMWTGYTNFSSTVFSPPNLAYGNESAATYVAYCWTPIAGYSAFGSYTGNGSADGPFVYLGFRPRWIMIKSSTTAQDWKLIDTSRNPYNSSNSLLAANTSSAEDTNAAYDFDILSNGFKPRNTFGYANTSGATYIYAAFAENPFKYALAR
jgi:hypothetical protein